MTELLEHQPLTLEWEMCFPQREVVAFRLLSSPAEEVSPEGQLNGIGIN